jgi:predicted nucleic acid-binding Zn ribbon protein
LHQESVRPFNDDSERANGFKEGERANEITSLSIETTNMKKQTHCTQCNQPIQFPATGRFCSRRCTAAFYETQPAVKKQQKGDVHYLDAFGLISAGYLPPARLSCPLDSRPLFDLEAVAKIVGVSQTELVKVLTSQSPRFDQEVRLG